MDLPSKKYYGVKCPLCPAVIWNSDQKVTELRCAVSFKDKGLPYIEEYLGIIIGFATKFKHTCRQDLDY